MNKKRKFTSIALAGALFCGIAGTTFVGCKDYDDDIDHVQQQIDELKGGSIASMDSQITALKQGQADLKSLITAIQTEVNALKSSKDAYVAADQALETRLKEAIKNGTDGLVSQADLKATMEEVNAMKGKFTELDAAFAEMLEEFENAFGPVVAPTSSIGDFANSLSKLIQALTDKVSEINARVNVCETSITNLNNQIKGINAQLSEKVNQENFSKFSRETFENIQKVSDDLEKVRTALLDSIYRVEGKLNSSLEAKIKDVQDDFKSVLGDYVKVTVLDERFASLEAKLEIDSTAIEGKINALNKLAEEFVTTKALEDALAGIKGDITNLQGKKVTLAGMLKEVENQKVFDARVNTLIEAALADLGPEGGKIENMDDLVKQVNANAAAINALTEKYNNLMGRVSALENRIQSIVYAPQAEDATVYFYTLKEGSVLTANAKTFEVCFKVYPLSYNLKDSVAAGKATLAIDYYKTRAVNAANLKCVKVEPFGSNEDGLWKATIEKANDLIGGFKAALAVTYNNATVSSDYFTIDNKEITLADLEKAIFTETVKEQSVKFDKQNFDLGLAENVLGFDATYVITAGTADYITCNNSNRQISLDGTKAKGHIGEKCALNVVVTVAGKTVNGTINLKISNADETTGLKRLVLIEPTGTVNSYYLVKVNTPRPNTYYYATNGNLTFKYKIDPVDYTLPLNDLKFDIKNEAATNLPIVTVVSSKKGEIVARIENYGWNNNAVALNYGDVYSEYATISESSINVNDIQIVAPAASQLPALTPTGKYSISYNATNEIVLVNRVPAASYSQDQLTKTNYSLSGATQNKRLSDVGFAEDITYKFVGAAHVGFELSADKKAIKAAGNNSSSLIGQTCQVQPVLTVTSVDGTTVYTKIGSVLNFELTASTSTTPLADYTWANVITVDNDPTETINLSTVSQWNVNYLRQIAEALGVTTTDLMTGNTYEPTISGITYNGNHFANAGNKIQSTGVLPVITLNNTLEKGDYVVAYVYQTTDNMGNVRKATVNVKFTVAYETFDSQVLSYVPGWWSDNNTKLTFAGQAISGVWDMVLNMDEVLKLSAVAVAKGWSIEYQEVNGSKLNVRGHNLTMRNPHNVATAGSASVRYTIKNSGGNVISTSEAFTVTFVDPIKNAIAERKAVTGYAGPKHSVSNAATASIDILEHLTWKDAHRNAEMINNSNKTLDATSVTLYDLQMTTGLYTNAACTVPFTDARATLTNGGKFTWTPQVSGAEFTKIQLYVKIVITTTYGDYPLVYPIAVER